MNKHYYSNCFTNFLQSIVLSHVKFDIVYCLAKLVRVSILRGLHYTLLII